jgi:hypothetical protein
VTILIDYDFLPVHLGFVLTHPTMSKIVHLLWNLKRKTMNKRENQSTIKSNAIRGPWSGYQIKRGWCGKEKDGVHEGFKVVSPFGI